MPERAVASAIATATAIATAGASPVTDIESERLRQENAELRLRMQELQDTLDSIHSGDVDALVVNGDIYTLESAHAATNRMRQDVLSQMKDAVFAFDGEGNVIFVNRAAERRYGIRSDEVLGRHRTTVFTESGGERNGLPAARRAGIEATHRLPNGHAMRVESITSPLRDARGDVIGSLVVVRDVSQRFREQSRRDALARLGDRLREVDDADESGLIGAELVGRTLEADFAGYACVDAGGRVLHTARSWSAAAASGSFTVTLTELGALASGAPPSSASPANEPAADGAAADLSSEHGALDALPAAVPQGSVLERLCRGDSVAADDWRGGRALGRSGLLVPLLERGRLAAVLYAGSHEPRRWGADALVFSREVAERVRLAVDRARAAAALRDSETRLRDANENLERAVAARTRELMAAEEALRQAQKMEAVGQLTGGIAHDFNNLLAGISASLQVLQLRVKQGKTPDVDRYVGMGQEAVRRAASLTQRLLAFARRQTLDPKPTDVNRLVAGMADLIRRTAGPSIELQVHSEGQLWLTQIDPSQLENALLNLCINARDAMEPGGGRLLLQTKNVRLDAGSLPGLAVTPGDYVAVSVSDTGAGMSAEVLKRVFDPFFTTKPLGQGTGLGLSMVYGFVRQSGGQVNAESTPGRGTTMTLFLPRHEGALDAEVELPPAADDAAGHGETVLVIEDEPTLRVLVAEALRERGYAVLTADDGPHGMQMLNSGARVDLLLTDVGLPGGMNGRQVADAARVAIPTLKVLFMTGYAENAAVRNGLLGPGMAVVTKPFEIAALTRRVRQLIDAGARSAVQAEPGDDRGGKTAPGGV